MKRQFQNTHSTWPHFHENVGGFFCCSYSPNYAVTLPENITFSVHGEKKINFYVAGGVNRAN